MFFSLRELVFNYSDALVKKAATSHRRRYADLYVCLDAFFSQKENIVIESFFRGVLTLRAAHASALFSVESKKENILRCFKKNNIPVKKIVCRV